MTSNDIWQKLLIIEVHDQHLTSIINIFVITFIA